MEFSKTNALNPLKHMSFINIIGQQLVIAGALVQHAIYCTGCGPEGIMLLQCNIWHVALWLGNN